MNDTNFAKVRIEKDYIRMGSINRKGVKITPTSITVHNTDNERHGANSRAHAKFLREEGYYTHNGEKIVVAWHFTVDDTNIIQHLPLNEKSLHAGRDANLSSISIEICMNVDGDFSKAQQNAANLIAFLLAEFKFTNQNIKRHKDWTGKDCPSLMYETGQWNTFLKMIPDNVAVDLSHDLFEWSLDPAASSEDDTDLAIGYDVKHKDLNDHIP